MNIMNLADIALRLAYSSDAPTLAAMSRDLIEVGLGWQYRAERIRQLLADPNIVTLIAADGERTAGFAAMTLGDERAHLMLLAIRPSHQRRGVGRRMARWLLDTAATAGIATVHLELRARNRTAYAFYRAQGFVETLRLEGYYRGRETAIRMMYMLRLPSAALPPWEPPARDPR
ncbi:MAG: GNAT family N-acetyltransferase [Casimicrobiaceae bacterium]